MTKVKQKKRKTKKNFLLYQPEYFGNDDFTEECSGRKMMSVSYETILHNMM